MFREIGFYRIQLQAHPFIGRKDGGEHVGTQRVVHHVRLHVVAKYMGRKRHIFAITVERFRCPHADTCGAAGDEKDGDACQYCLLLYRRHGTLPRCWLCCEKIIEYA
ncbi:hypothetical protein D3C71_524830 [compost metagenome]